MPTVNIDYQVFMTHCHTIANDHSIGTDGLATCVGIIAAKTNDTVFCAHMSCSISGLPANEVTIKAKTIEIMAAQLGAKASVTSIQCATSSLKDKTAQWIIEAITATYDNVVSAEGNGVYWDKTKAVVTQYGTDIVGTEKGSTTDDGPMDVKN